MLQHGPFRLSVVVTHHPARAQRLAPLLAKLGHSVMVAEDDRGAPPGLGGLEYTFLKAIRMMPQDATHHLILQDDILPCRDLLLAVVTKILPVLPQVPIGLYSNCREPEGMTGPWILGDCWGQTKLMPAGLWELFSEFNQRAFIPGKGRFSTDLRVGLFYRTYGRDVWCTVPSLVEHDNDGAGSLLKHASRVTKARRFIGEHASALTVDWSNTAEPPKARPSFQALLKSQVSCLEPVFWRSLGVDVKTVRAE